MAWKNTAMGNAIVLDLMIKEMVKNKDQIPTQLVESVDNISRISSEVESLKANHKANLKPLVHQASGLIIVLWRLYLKDRYPSLWPPPLLKRTVVVKFVTTVDSIRKLLARKCEKRSVKRKIFVLLDLGKAKKYLYELDAAAKNIEGDLRHVVDVNAVLLEAVDEFHNSQDEAQLLEAIVEDTGNIPEPVTVVEGSRQPEHEAEKSRFPEIRMQKLEAVEEDHEVETSTGASRETPTSQSSSLSSLRHIRGFFNNIGSGIMINRNIGNTYNATITNFGNNNYVNHYHR